jgi:tRNA(Ile2) C34 agmatinyltransferase TiaS
MYLIRKGEEPRPICRDCRQRVGPPGRKVWRCIDCQIARAKRRGQYERIGGMELYRYATEGR